jgi:hypothetical protein
MGAERPHDNGVIARHFTKSGAQSLSASVIDDHEGEPSDHHRHGEKRQNGRANADASKRSCAPDSRRGQSNLLSVHSYSFPKRLAGGLGGILKLPPILAVAGQSTDKYINPCLHKPPRSQPSKYLGWQDEACEEHVDSIPVRDTKCRVQLNANEDDWNSHPPEPLKLQNS